MDQQSLAGIFSGNTILDDAKPISQAYAGHQFGHFTMLGDGRAILLGEHVTRDTEQRYDIQFKGSGTTPYSRGGDGRAGLGPMLREYLISEAMAHLGIPTTRGLAVISTGEMIHREQPLRGAVLTRVASSHLRVGTFQFARAYCSIKELKQLADYALQRHDPLLMLEEDCYVMFLENVVKRQAALVAQWQLIGFIHGVMNTDNMTISGETIDYGPCAFMDKFHPDTAFSSIDLEGRYKYSQQPQIAHWNLTRFAETLLPLIDQDEKVAINRAEQVIQQFPFYYMEYWLDGMRNKLGIFNEEDEDQILFTDLLHLMTKYEADHTAVFIGLTTLKMDRLRLFNTEQFKEWYERYESRLKRQNQSKDDVIRLMKQHNPSIIPRNDFIE